MLQERLNEDQPSTPKLIAILSKNDLLRIFIFEILGTFILSFGILCSKYIPPLSDKIPNPFHDICISLSLYLAIILAAPFTGGHFNPAVTLAMLLKINSNQNAKKTIVFLVAQFIGALVAVLLAKSIYDCQIVPYEDTVSVFKVMKDGVGEFVGGFLFIYIILTVTGSETTFIFQTSWVHIFIPVGLFAARSLSYYVGGLNPAIVITFQLYAIITKDTVPGNTFLQVFIVQVLCVIGACIAVVFYQRIYKPVFIKNQ